VTDSPPDAPGTDADRPLIEIRGLVKAYGLLPVLRGLNLDVPRGQFLALLGPNGSGKSTLLRLLAGLTPPNAGRVRIGGWDIPHEAQAIRAHIGLVAHRPLLYENLTARENLLFFARLYDLPAAEIGPRADAMLAQVGLSRRAHDLARTFSRGMQQRLSIARALLHDPDVLLLDEPYTGLDQQAATTLDTVLTQARAAGSTIVMATHQLDRAAGLADRVAIVMRGAIAYDRPSAELDTVSLAADYAAATGMVSAR
jgi:heme exporter protein A